MLPPPALFLTAGELFEAIDALPRTDLQTAVLPEKAGNHNFVTAALPDIAADAKSRAPLARLENLLAQAQGPVLFCAESAGRREAMLDVLRPLGITPAPVSGWEEFATSDAPWLIAVHPLERGFVLPDSQRILITETELFGQRVFQRRRRSREREVADQAVKNLTELRPGAPVVHIDHGVGRYLGLQSLAVDGAPQEFLALEYAEGAKLYVPVANLFLISRYSGGDPDAAPLHRLGAETWQKAKEKAAREIRDTAAELLDADGEQEQENDDRQDPRRFGLMHRTVDPSSRRDAPSFRAARESASYGRRNRSDNSLPRRGWRCHICRAGD